MIDAVDLVAIKSDTDQLEMHTHQVQIEKDHNNPLRTLYLEPTDEKIYHMRGHKTCA